MRITLIISSMSSGGAERVMSIMANYWAKNRKDVTLITLAGDVEPFYPLTPRIRQTRLSFYWPSANIASAMKNAIKRFTLLRSAIRDTTPDIVVSFIDMTNARVVMALLGTGIPVIISERSDPANRHKIGRSGRLFCSLVYPLADRLVAQSGAAMAFFPRRMERRISVIPNPVSAPQVNNRGPQLPSPMVVTVGRQSMEKDQALLIRAFAKLPGDHSHWSLVVIGDGPLHEELKRLAADLGIADRVIFTGVVDNVGSYLTKAGIFVLPSRYEGFPNALCEAMASGVASITTDFAAVHEIVRHEESGLIVPTQDTAAMTGALARLMSDTHLRRSLAEHGRELSHRFSTQQVMTLWDEAIRATKALPGP